MLVVQSPGFQDPFVEVHAMWILFDPEKQLAVSDQHWKTQEDIRAARWY